jgi:hypothetical protein
MASGQFQNEKSLVVSHDLNPQKHLSPTPYHDQENHHTSTHASTSALALPMPQPSSLQPPVPVFRFPSPASSPHDIDLRVPSQGATLAQLDAVYNAAEHPILCGQGAGHGGYNEEEDETICKKALIVLNDHIKARVPYIELATDRLQAVTSVRNDRTFELPDPPKMSSSPSMADDLGRVDGKFDGAGGDGRGEKVADSGGAGPEYVIRRPAGMHTVDLETGEGLLEFLLQKGKEQGFKKLACHSISFHDFTPEMRNGKYRNILLAHYAVKKVERIDMYEVDL